MKTLQRRALLVTWIVVCPIIMTSLWAILKHWIFSVAGDDTAASMVAFMSVAVASVAVGAFIAELPVTDKEKYR